MTDRVLLTGISGFLGGHIALQLLNAGYSVCGSLRSLDRADHVRAALAQAGADTTQLDFVALELTADAGWQQAMAGCRYLQHTASPLMLTTPRDPDELITPAVDGTSRALTAALAAGVERIVLTSSIAAIQYGHADAKLLTEADWTDPASAEATPYARSKTLAERQAWSLMAAAGRQADLAVINPAIIIGPLLDADPGTSAVLIQRLLQGHIPAAPKLDLPLIDVRDVAALHVAAMTAPTAGGQRHIALAETLSVLELSRVLASAFPDARLPGFTVPNWLIRLAAQFVPEVRANLPELDRRRSFASNRASVLLGRPFLPVRQAIIATSHSLIAHRLLSHH